MPSSPRPKPGSRWSSPPAAPPRWLNVINELPIAPPDHPLATSHTEVIASNGALLWDLTTDSQVHAEPVDAGGSPAR